jgi:membrane protease YdiL (CAAX protease family)
MSGPGFPQARPAPAPAPGERRHWWSLAPMPTDSPVISTRQAYLEVIGVYLIFFGPSIVAAVGSLANYTQPNPEGWWITGPNGFEEIVQAATAVLVVLLLAQRRGRTRRDVGLVLARQAGGPGTRQAIRMAAWAVLAFFVGSIVTSALATGNFPYGHVSAANTVLDLTAAGNAGIVEELIVVGFLVTTLEQARRSRWEIFGVALICRAGYHIYYGPGVVGILVWAAVFLWLFWRFRSIVPMVIAHICWDTLVFLAQVTDAFDAVLLLGAVALMITAGVLWLMDRSDRQTAPTGGPWPVGWQGGPPGYWHNPPAWAPGGAPPPGALPPSGSDPAHGVPAHGAPANSGPANSGPAHGGPYPPPQPGSQPTPYVPPGGQPPATGPAQPGPARPTGWEAPGWGAPAPGDQPPSSTS